MQGYLKNSVDRILKEKYNLSGINFKVEKPKRKEFGDLSTNVAFLLTKTLKRNPFEIATEIAEELKKDLNFESVDVAKPAFINVRFSKKFYYSVLREILDKGFEFYKENIGLGRKVQVEYVSANPTGPLHLGHARGGVVGDVISNLLEFYGWNVTREYYVNDAGNQIRMLGLSILYRYLELLKSFVNKEDRLYTLISELLREVSEEFEQNGYRGEYIKELAEEVYDLYREQILELTKEEAIPSFRSSD